MYMYIYEYQTEKNTVHGLDVFREVQLKSSLSGGASQFMTFDSFSKYYSVLEGGNMKQGAVIPQNVSWTIIIL